MLADLDRGLVTVTGEDAGSFLQSLLSQDLDPLRDGEGAHALLLQPQGKLVADLRVLRVDARTWWCDCERPYAPALAEGLARFRVRVRADVRDESPGVAAVAVRGRADVADALARLGAELPAAAHAHVAWRGARVVRSAWPGEPGIDVIGPRGDVQAAREATGLATAAPEALERLRIEAGVARQGHDVDERTIAQEAFLDETAVSFTKGCFVGQELVCRIDTRGHVNRYLRRLRAEGPVVPGATVTHGGRAVGEVTSAVGGVALAMVRREVEPPAEVLVTWEDGARPARLEALRAAP
jgi:folate-binding protein YgfZ